MRFPSIQNIKNTKHIEIKTSVKTVKDLSGQEYKLGFYVCIFNNVLFLRVFRKWINKQKGIARFYLFGCDFLLKVHSAQPAYMK